MSGQKSVVLHGGPGHGQLVVVPAEDNDLGVQGTDGEGNTVVGVYQPLQGGHKSWWHFSGWRSAGTA